MCFVFSLKLIRPGGADKDAELSERQSGETLPLEVGSGRDFGSLPLEERYLMGADSTVKKQGSEEKNSNMERFPFRDLETGLSVSLTLKF